MHGVREAAWRQGRWNSHPVILGHSKFIFLSAIAGISLQAFADVALDGMRPLQPGDRVVRAAFNCSACKDGDYVSMDKVEWINFLQEKCRLNTTARQPLYRKLMRFNADRHMREACWTPTASNGTADLIVETEPLMPSPLSVLYFPLAVIHSDGRLQINDARYAHGYVAYCSKVTEYLARDMGGAGAMSAELCTAP